MSDPQTRSIAIAREALATPPAARAELLRERCGGDEELVGRVRAVIARMESVTMHGGAGLVEAAEAVSEDDAHAAATIFGIASTSAELFESAPADERDRAAGAALPDRIGSYRVLGVLGEGGMGMVYLAEQERPRRTVALKVVRPGMMGAMLLRRFELEAQVLARLQHPNIAQVYEAGIARTGPGGPGSPFFAMEYIQGATLTDHATVRGLGVRERLALMAEICDGVQHAHTRGVIHRDLKPGNILVSAEGRPKILDFGIARATDSDVQATQRTDIGQLVGTLPYMSPEQVQGDPAALDTRSDVYTLGVILYELLTGRLPHDVGRRTIFEAAQTISQAQAASVGAVVPALRGDVSTIVAKAMEKDRQRRYQTASELAADINRFLRSEPIAARPASTAYQLRKFAGRHKGLVAGASAAVALLVLGVVGTSAGMVRAIAEKKTADQQRARADDEASTAEAINEFLVDRMLAAATPEQAQGRQITVSEVVGKAAGEIDSAFAQRPMVRARLYDTVGKTYTSLGEYDKAEKFLAGGVELRRQDAPGSAELGAALHQLGSLRFRQSRWADAEALFREAAAVFGGTGRNDRELIESRSSLAACLRNLGRLEEAEREQRLSIDQARARLGPENATTLSAIANLAIVLHDNGRVRDAEKLYREVAETRARVLGMSHPSTLMALGNLAAALYDLGDIEGAEQAQARSLEVRKKVSGPDHPETLLDMSNLAVMREKLGRVAEAEALYREALVLATHKLGEENESVAVLMSNLASNLAKQNRDDDAERLYLRSSQILAKVDGPDHAETIQNELGYAKWLLQKDRLADAEPILERVYLAVIAKFGEEYPASIGAAAAMATLREKQGRLAEALPLAEKALAGRRRLLGDDHSAVKEAQDMVDRLKARKN